MAAAASNPVELLAGLLQRFSPSGEQRDVTWFFDLTPPPVQEYQSQF